MSVPLRSFSQSGMVEQLIDYGVEPVMDPSTRVWGFRCKGDLVVDFGSDSSMAAWIAGQADVASIAADIIDAHNQQKAAKAELEAARKAAEDKAAAKAVADPA